MAKLHTTGIVLQPGGLEWTILRSDKGESPAVESTSPAITESAENVTWEALLEKDKASLMGRLQVVLPAATSLMNVVHLPTSDPEEIAGMVELQADEVLPYPVDQVYLSHEVLHQDEQNSTVVMVAVLQHTIDALGETFQEHKLRIDRLDVDLLACWDLMSSQYLADEGRRLVLVLDRTACFFVVCDSGVPVHMAHLGAVPESREDFEFLIDDVDMTLASLDAEGAAPDVSGLELWHWGGVPHFLSLLEGQLGVKVKARNLQELSRLSEGVAYRGLRGDGVVNLVPQSWKDLQEQHELKIQSLKLVGAMVAVWLLGMGLFNLFISLDTRHVGKLEKEVAALEEPVRSVSALQSRVQSLSLFTNQTFSVLECFRETSVLMPSGVELTSWNYSKGKQVLIRGKSRQNSQVFTFNEQLENSGLFSEIVNDGSSRGSDGFWEFKLTARLPEVTL